MFKTRCISADPTPFWRADLSTHKLAMYPYGRPCCNNKELLATRCPCVVHKMTMCHINKSVWQGRESNNSDVATSVLYMVLLHLQVGLCPYETLKWVSWELWDTPLLPPPQRLLCPFKSGHLNRHRQPSRHLSFTRASPQIPTWLVENLSLPTMIEWTIGGRVHPKVTHLSPILTLGSLSLEFTWDLDEGLRFMPPLVHMKQAQQVLKTTTWEMMNDMMLWIGNEIYIHSLLRIK